ncbi:unnamed protein product, partial [Mesorhabditis spiculigera]
MNKLSELPMPEVDHRKILIYPSFSGQPTDRAILRLVQDFTFVHDVRKRWDIVFEIPFNKSRRWNIVIAREAADIMADDDELITFHVFLKGAPEDIVEKCGYSLEELVRKPIDDDFLLRYKETYTLFARNGLSSIGLAHGTFDALAGTEFSQQLGNFVQDGLTLVGICGLSDPPRPETRRQIEAMANANIKLHLVTGDHPTAAAAVAEMVGMGPQQEVCVVSGDIIDSLSDAEWDVLLEQKHAVFARTSPQQKKKIVEEALARGESVCATGDGILDAPALRAANVGVAINSSGGAFAKETADVLVPDGNLGNILTGIEQGRLLYENLKKTIAYTLAHLLPELVPVFMTFVFGWPLALGTMQVLTIDLLTELPPSISLIYECAERDLMRKLPRRLHHHLVSRSLLFYAYIIMGSLLTTGCYAAYIFVFWHHGIAPWELGGTVHKHWFAGGEKIMTESGLLFDGVNQEKIAHQAAAAYQITLVGAQLIHLLNCRTRRLSIFKHSPPRVQTLFAVLISLIMVVACVYIPGINQIVGVAPPPVIVWVFPFAIGVLITVFNEIRKYYIRHSPANPIVRFFKW